MVSYIVLLLRKIIGHEAPNRLAEYERVGLGVIKPERLVRSVARAELVSIV